jgi:glycosyltransferase involved in cell wall biosynthesis
MLVLRQSKETDRMKILLLITGLGVGGAETQVTELASQFAERGHTVMLAFMTGQPEVLPRHPAVTVCGLGMHNSVSGMLTGYRALRRLVKNYQPDVVHSHMVHANLLARVVRLSCRMPRLISTAHSNNEGGKARMLAYRVTDALADLSTNVSDIAVAAFEEKGAVPKGRMVTISNGIATDRFRHDPALRKELRAGLEPNTKLILAVGRLVDVKDYPNLLRAFALVSKNMQDAVLWIAGGGERLEELQALSQELGISRAVSFLGIRSDTEALYNAADVSVLSSKWEGFGLVVAEAMASENVVVATDCGGVREVLGECGYLVPAQDPVRLAAALQQALVLPKEDAMLLGRKARQRVLKHYSLHSTVDAWAAIYRPNSAQLSNIK